MQQHNTCKQIKKVEYLCLIKSYLEKLNLNSFLKALPIVIIVVSPENSVIPFTADLVDQFFEKNITLKLIKVSDVLYKANNVEDYRHLLDQESLLADISPSKHCPLFNP